MLEHHANVVPWQLVAKHTGAELVYLPLTDDYLIDTDALEGSSTTGSRWSRSRACRTSSEASARSTF